jgi:DNA-directed DNA polymerase III PolC
MSFALPGCRSNFSLLWGTAFPEQLVDRAAALGIAHFGLADNDNLYGAIDFARACRDAGINPLIGVRLTTSMGVLHLIAKSYSGYQNLCRLVTARQLQGVITDEQLQCYSHDIVCLAPMNSPFDTLKDIFEANLYLSLKGNEDRRIDEIIDQYSTLPIANPTVSFIEPKDYKLHLLLRAIDSGSLFANLNGVPHDGRACFFPDNNDVTKRFSHLPEAVANGLILARQCQVDFPAHKNLLPDYPDYDGDKAELLRTKALDGLIAKKKTSPPTGKYLSRLEFELAVIKRTGFTDYFLIVSGIVDHCHNKGIPVVGRGSAGGSLVAYSLGITQVDPINEGLYFERFLNEARSDPPDIDLDIDWRRRDDVLEYVYDRYGHDRTAMIATYTRFRGRMAVREVAKAAGFPPDEISRFSKRLPYVDPSQINKAISKMPRSVKLEFDLDRYRPILENAARLDNFPRHLGIHPGGIVITPRPMTDYVALERATKGLVVTQCDMYQAEKLGLIKIDILGQRGQAVIVDCLEHARKTEGKDFTVPDNNPDAYKLLQSGKTIGVFQIESPGLRALLRDILPDELNDITLALALIRPGASDSGMKKVFLDRHHGRETTVYPDDRLEDVLKETHGVFIYQEQVLLCARAVAGFNLPAADMLRRAITKDRKGGKYKKLCQRFLDGAIKTGLPAKKAIEIFKLLSHFAGFGFCKAHAATYGYLAYQSAYFKTHYPAQFMTAVLNNDGGYYPASVYIAETRRLGVEIVPPDINTSGPGESIIDGKMMVGLQRVRNLECETIDQIMAERPFGSFDDFLARVRLSETEAENLIKVGAFDNIAECGPHLLWRLRLRRRHGQKLVRGSSETLREMSRSSIKNHEQGNNGTLDDFFAGQLIVPRAKKLPKLPDFTPFEKYQFEREILGFPSGRHPLTLLPKYDYIAASVLLRKARKSNSPGPTSVSGWLVDIKTIKTREKRETMVFLTCEDLEDTFEVVLFPEKYKEYASLIRRYRFFRIEGEINIDGGNVAIIAETLSPAPTGLEEKPYI